MPALLPLAATSSRIRLCCSTQITNLTSLDLSTSSSSSHDYWQHFQNHSASRRRPPEGHPLGPRGFIQRILADTTPNQSFPSSLQVVDTQLRALTLRCPHLSNMCLRQCVLLDTTPADWYPPSGQGAYLDQGWSYNALLHATNLVKLDLGHSIVRDMDGALGRFGAFLPRSLTSLSAVGLAAESLFDLWRAVLACEGLELLRMPVVHDHSSLAKTIILLGGKCPGWVPPPAVLLGLLLERTMKRCLALPGCDVGSVTLISAVKAYQRLHQTSCQTSSPLPTEAKYDSIRVADGLLPPRQAAACRPRHWAVSRRIGQRGAAGYDPRLPRTPNLGPHHGFASAVLHPAVDAGDARKGWSRERDAVPRGLLAAAFIATPRGPQPGFAC